MAMPDPLQPSDHPGHKTAAPGQARTRMALRVQARTAHGVVAETPGMAGLLLYRIDHAQPNSCSVYEPCVALILQGRKRILLGDETLDCDPDRYLISSLDLPVQSAVTEASPEIPFLGVALRLDWRELTSLMLSLPPAGGGSAAGPAVDRSPGLARSSAKHGRAMSTGAVTAELLDAFDRLLGLLDQPQDMATLAPLIKREIHYRLLVGEAGARLRQIATVDSQSHQVARAIDRLNADFCQTLRVQTLAREAGMSISTFHHHFKSLTAMSPLQYQKQLRLGEARRLMLAEGMDAATAAYRVGYESPSQFSREYRRMFGAPPSTDMAVLRQRPHRATADEASWA